MRLTRKITLEVPSVLVKVQLEAFVQLVIDEFTIADQMGDRSVEIPAGTELHLIVEDTSAEKAVEALLNEPEPEAEFQLVADHMDVVESDAMLHVREICGTSGIDYSLPREVKLKHDDIRVWREANNLSMGELGTLLGVSNSAVRLWETGETRQTPRMLAKLANLMDLSPWELVNGPLKSPI